MSEENQVNQEGQRFGFVAVAGAPNAGKSTLINALVGAKVSIVSAKVQTTRTRVMGVALYEQSQVVFVDTPGIFQPSKNNTLEKAIVAAAWEGVEEAEMLILMVDASKKKDKVTDYIIDHLKENKPRQVILVLNKIDKIRRAELINITMRLNEQLDFDATFMISALKNDGTQKLMEYLAAQVPEGQWHYPEDYVSDMPMRLMAAEVTREKLFNRMHQELPYSLTVETDEWEQFENGDIKISQVVYVSREAHKKIILGKGGEMLGQIGKYARQELSDIMEVPVHLKLFVKVRENWQEDEERYKLWGLTSHQD